MAREDLKNAYKKSLRFLQRYCLTNDEMPFMVYSRLLKIMQHDPDCLEFVNPNVSEEDYVIKIWGRLVVRAYS
ncbi:hypothetical protein CU097_015321 [Rhizopus azygosporus]|uniref:Uncharacterized protein n=2 Tax=Rhizopus TaxID=4842 RepID=A0A367K867_RHIAZ|nr:hypothetical protein BCV71DRAFT_224956 [Rhizopus microsporus]RCH98375.1 hypothetical protein CU097_015321 [Rhizopus azygosporus]